MTKLAVTIKEAIEISGIGRTSLYGLFKTGELTPRKRGSQTLILVEDLEKYLKSLPVAA